MPNNYTTRDGRTAKRGLFTNGVWLCDCEPRLPANKFLTKNGGQHHGKWFYTCQQPKHKGNCSFWLLADDAKIREESAVLSNSRSEPEPLANPTTPRKQTTLGAPPTPQTRTSITKTEAAKTPAPAKDSGNLDFDESFAWSSSDDEALLRAEREVLEATPFETPKKAPRTEIFTSPGKRDFSQALAPTPTGQDVWPLSDDVFTTPSTSHRSRGTGMLSPDDTPAHGPSQTGAGQPGAEPSVLAAEALSILRSSNPKLNPMVENELVELLNMHDLRTKGIIKGRDITRLAIQAKDKKIGELQVRISTLEAEKEMNRNVISHLKMDIATSPKKGKDKQMPPARRSEV